MEKETRKPVLLFKLGSAKDGIVPSKKDVEKFKSLLEEAEINKDFKILITSWLVDVSLIGTPDTLGDMKVINLEDEAYDNFIEELKS